MELVRAKPHDFTNDELRTQAGGQEGGDVIVFRVLSGGSEVGLVILSLPCEMEEAELEKLYVPTSLRQRGVGGRALECAEDYCRQHQFRVLRLWANPLDEETDQERLIAWYRRFGYVDAEDLGFVLRAHRFRSEQLIPHVDAP